MGDAGKVINEAVMKAVYHMPVKVRAVSLGEGLDATICIPVPVYRRAARRLRGKRPEVRTFSH